MNSFCLVGYNFEEQLTIFFLRFTKLHFIAKQNGCCGVYEKKYKPKSSFWSIDLSSHIQLNSVRI